MNLDRILGQHEIKEKIYNSILNESFPQSKILVDRDGYGGLNMAVEIAKSILKNDSSFQGDIYDHPDLHFLQYTELLVILHHYMNYVDGQLSSFLYNFLFLCLTLLH